MKTLSLLKDWTLREEPLSCGVQMAQLIARKEGDWMQVPTLPCDVHMALVDNGRMEDPLIGTNTFDCRWVENRSWWFRKTFALEEAQLNNFGAELFIEILDIHADVFLNGCHLGHHDSAFYPFRKDVSPWLKAGENELLVRLSTGIEHVDDRELEPIRDFVACEWRRRREGRGDYRRACLRKPQYAFGWDQSPHLATCAIAGDVRLEFLDEVVVRDIRFETLELTEEGARILAEAEVESREWVFARECSVTFSVEREGRIVHTCTRNYLSQTGTNFLDFSFTLPEPELWWPNGYGEQPLYTVRVKASNQNGAKDEKSITTGIRTVELDQTPLSADERQYAFVINGKRIYCKGMDVIHTDVIYARATDELYERLLAAAKNADFTMIRLWDGAFCYERDLVYDLCNRYGLLVYQNFTFACSLYPDHLPWFRKAVEEEAAYQIRRLRNHPCIVMWSGCGESLGMVASFLGQHYWEREHRAIHPGGTTIFGEILPRIHHQLVATVPYQCCSPFGGFDFQQSPLRGECHRYPFLNINPDYQQTRISYEVIDTIEAKFLSEGGIMGPPSKEVLLHCCGGEENTAWDSPVFEHHRNTFERWAVRDGIYRHYTGQKELSLDEYCLYGGLFQGSLLAYEADRLRSLEHCNGCVLWCFTDGFGEVGFSLMDRFGNPKPAYYYLHRAYAPDRLILRREEDRVKVFCSNDSAEPKTYRLACGYVSFAGEYGPAEEVTVEVPAFTKLFQAAEYSLEGLDLIHGAFYAHGGKDGPLPVTLRVVDFRQLELACPAKLTVTDVVQEGEKLSFTVSTDVFAHAVHFGLPADRLFSDQYFDLLPGESRRVTLYNSTGLTAEDILPAAVFMDE